MKILFKKQLFDLEVKGQGLTKVIMVCDTPPYGHAPTYQIYLTYLEGQNSYGPDKLRWEAEAEEKIRLRGDIIMTFFRLYNQGCGKSGYLRNRRHNFDLLVHVMFLP